MSVLLNSAVDPHKFTPLGVMFHVGQHKHAFPTSHGYIFPESVAPEDAALSPDAEALNSKQSRPALTAEPHGHFNEKDHLAPSATLYSPKHLRKGQRRARVRRGEGEPLTTELALPPLLSKPFPESGTWETEGMIRAPTCDRPLSRVPRTRPPRSGSVTWPNLRGKSGARGTGSPCP